MAQALELQRADQGSAWIYPGDQVLLRHPNSLGQGPTVATRSIGGGQRGRLTRAGGKRVSKDSVFLRDQGFIGDPEKDEWGEVAGAVEEQMLLAEGSNVYLLLEDGKNVNPGQELTIYRAVRQPEACPARAPRRARSCASTAPSASTASIRRPALRAA